MKTNEIQNITEANMIFHVFLWLDMGHFEPYT